MGRLVVPFSLCTLWFMVAWAIDKFWFTVFCSECSALFAFEFSLKHLRELITIETDRVSAIFLFVVPFATYALFLIPFKNFRSSEAWGASFRKWSRPFFWLFQIFVWVWLIEGVYSVLSPSLPESFRNFAEAYQLRISGVVLGVKEISIKGGLGGLFGLIVGVILFLSNGVAREK